MKGKRFNLFDLVVVIIILGIAAAIIFRTQIKDTVFGGEIKTFSVSVRCDAISNEAIETITKGSALYETENKKTSGMVISVVATPIIESVIVGSEEQNAESSHFSSLDIVLQIEGYVKNNSFFTRDGEELLIQKEMVLENSETRFKCTLESIEISADYAESTVN